MQLRDFILLNINGQRLFSRQLKDFNVFKELKKIFDHYGTFQYRTTELESIVFDINNKFKLSFKDKIYHDSHINSSELIFTDYEITNRTTLKQLRKELVRCLIFSGYLTNYNTLPYLSEEDINGLKMLRELVS